MLKTSDFALFSQIECMHSSTNESEPLLSSVAFRHSTRREIKFAYTKFVFFFQFNSSYLWQTKVDLENCVNKFLQELLLLIQTNKRKIQNLCEIFVFR